VHTTPIMPVALLCWLPLNTLAQSAPWPQPAELDTVMVTGIRSSLESSLHLKRDSDGVVDGIIAEDMGKFPDTNLAESLQRISGISIDRSQSGEGQRITVRGMGPDFNMVLLNGRQMPTANIPGNAAGISNSRAFDFANLATEAVSELQVYKTTRADKPTGGMGATIDIRTARPLDQPGLRASLGVKGVMDRAVRNTPSAHAGDTITPEVSGIFSQSFADNRFGIAASASYQARDTGYSQARINRWIFLRGDDALSSNRLPLPDEPAFTSYQITNRPGPDTIYARPTSIGYLVSAEKRQRRNAQMVMQFAPVDSVKASVDYTFADNRMQRHNNEMFIQFRNSAGASTWSDGPISAPLMYSEYMPSGRGYTSINNTLLAIRSELNSAGFNLEWQPSDALDFSLDYHNSKSEVRPDSPLGSTSFIATSAFVRGDTSVDFSGRFPILNIQLAPGVSQLEPEHGVLGLTGFRSAYSRSEVEQLQANGRFRFGDYQALDFGVAGTDVFNRVASSENSIFDAMVGTPADYADDIWTVDHYRNYFKRFPGHHDPGFSDRFLIADFDRLRERGIQLRNEASFSPFAEFTNDLRTTEQSRSAYLQWRNSFNWAIPVNLAIGMRHETTKVRSPSQVLPPAGNILWISDDNLRMVMADEPILDDGGVTGKYHYWLPNLDIRADLRENLLLRASYGKSIGRPGWRDLQGGLSVTERYGQLLGGSGIRGNPALLPRESKNFDLSLEWYYAEGSYAALGYFRKNIKNFIGSLTTTETPYPIYNPIGGGYWNEAIQANACMENDFSCIRAWIFANRANAPGVSLPTTGNQGTISGIPGDPLAQFLISTPVNQRADTLDGFEISVQHMFANSGFGISANYTKVDSGLRYDNLSLEDQYPMAGLSDSANLVVFYDKHHWQIRAAWSWRDEFLSTDGGSTGSVATDPYYTESYRQLDLNATYLVNDHLSVFVEGLNLTDETQRRYIRHPNMLADASQTGTRYMFGLRYRF